MYWGLCKGTVHMWRWKDNFVVSGFSFHPLCFWAWDSCPPAYTTSAFSCWAISPAWLQHFHSMLQFFPLYWFDILKRELKRIPCLLHVCSSELSFLLSLVTGLAAKFTHVWEPPAVLECLGDGYNISLIIIRKWTMKKKWHSQILPLERSFHQPQCSVSMINFWNAPRRLC